MTTPTTPDSTVETITTPAGNVVELHRPKIHVTGSGLADELNAAEYLGCSTRTLQRMRQQKRGPKIVLMNGRVWYRLVDLDEYMLDRLIDPLAS